MKTLIIFSLLFLIPDSVEARREKMRGLSNDVITAKMKERLTEIRACYKDEKAKNPKLGGGKVTVHLSVSGDGTVTNTQVEKSTLNNFAVEKCLAHELLSLKFPVPEGGGTVDVSYPFLFDPATLN